jgi:hypothetical protein
MPFADVATIRRMGRYTFPAFNIATTPRYVVVWDLQWTLIESERLEPAADLSGAMAVVLERLSGDGWQAEATPEYGFVFIRRDAERRLLMLTPRDPLAAGAQSFSPFGSIPAAHPDQGPRNPRPRLRANHARDLHAQHAAHSR